MAPAGRDNRRELDLFHGRARGRICEACPKKCHLLGDTSAERAVHKKPRWGGVCGFPIRSSPSGIRNSMTAFALTLILIAALLHAMWNLCAKRAGGGLPLVWLVG